MKLNEDTKKIIALFFIWRSVMFFISLIIISLFNVPKDRFGEVNIFFLWSNWDGGHYVGIAANGYRHIMQYAFFPLYPMLIKTLDFLINDPFISALIISNTFFLGTLILLYKVSLLYGLSKKSAFNVLYLLMIFPTSFFLGAAYTESLFLFFCLLSIYLAKNNRWFLSSVACGFACFTKFIAIAILFVLLCEYFTQRNITFKNVWKRLNPNRIDEPIVYLAFFGPFGIYLYSLFLFWNTGYWFFFRDAQMHWGRSLSLVNPLNVINQSLNEYLLDMRHGYLNFSVHSLETIVVIISVFFLPFIYKRFGFALTVYTFMITTFTLFSGKVDSSLRYVLTAFPAFMLMGWFAEKSEIFKYFLTLLFAPLLGIALGLFLTLNWIG